MLAACAALLLAAMAAAWRLPEGAVRYVDVPTVVLPVPATPPRLVPAEALARLSAAEPASLVELPRPDPCARPCVAVVVTGLGLAAEATARAIGLPAAVALSFSPYAGDLAIWAARAQGDGHELMLDLSLQPQRYPEDDAGPLTLLVGEPAWELGETLGELLKGRDGWIGAAAAAAAFAAEPARFAPIAAALAARKLAFVELAAGKLEPVAREAALAYASTTRPAAPSAPGIDRALAAAEASARRTGRAMLALPPTPVALNRLAAWAGGLAARGIALAPASAVFAGAERQEARRP